MNTKIIDVPYNNSTIDYCVEQIKNGNIGIFPTDTVYGIGCDALNITALKKLYKVKKRNFKKPINILISNKNMLNKYVKNINSIEQKLIDNFWPGDLTIIFNKSNIVPDLLTSGLETIGIRMPDNKICLEIIEKLGKPIAMSSANISDNAPDSSLEEILEDFNNKVHFIINSGIIYNKPSTIVRIDNNEIKILRQGVITLDKIMEVLEKC